MNRTPEVMIAILLPALMMTGCERSKPRSSAHEELKTIRHQVDHSVVEVQEIYLEGQNLFGTMATVKQNTTLRVTGSMQVHKNKQLGESYMAGLVVAFMPANSSDSDWEAAGSRFQYPAVLVGGGVPTFDFSGSVTVSPGDYDVRVYSTATNMDDPKPFHHLQGRGRVRVLTD
jgi:hypothetical protein